MLRGKLKILGVGNGVVVMSDNQGNSVMDKETKEDILRNLKYERELKDIASAFRHSDKYFPSFSFEGKVMLNIVGKILGDIVYLLTIYRYAYNNEEYQLKIRTTLADIKEYVENKVKELKKEEGDKNE